MSGQRLEAFLAQLYVDEPSRRRFLADPRAEAAKAGLSEPDCAALEQIDAIGLELAADSLAKKRAGQITGKMASRFSRWFRRN